jgi:plasmid replication initiation protein
MARVVEGGIEKHQDLKRFMASSANVTAKDQMDLMSRCWFSLTPDRTDPIEHEFIDARTKRTETVRITGSGEHGIATIHDQDLLIFVISQWIDAKRVGLEPTRRISFTPYQFFTWMGKAPQGTAYARLREALHRLKTTNVETTIRSQSVRLNRVKQFSWISEWEITEEDGKIRGVEVVLAEWLFESIRDFHVLTLDKRYFGIAGPVERWLYLYASKATGGTSGQWKETFRSLYRKSASQQAYKHYANTLRKLVNKNDLPGLRLERRVSSDGKDMLFMERIEKRIAVKAAAEKQFVLIEQTPLEEAWENALDLLRQQLGEATANSWVKPLHVVKFENATVTYRAPTKFLADWVQSRYLSQLRKAWKAVGYKVENIAFAPTRKSAENAAFFLRIKCGE